MAIKVITPDAAAEDFKQLLAEVDGTADEIVLEVGGKPVGMVRPLSQQAQDEALRESFGRFWDVHEAYIQQKPEEWDEDELMDYANKIVKEIRAEFRTIREAVERVEGRDRVPQSA